MPTQESRLFERVHHACRKPPPLRLLVLTLLLPILLFACDDDDVINPTVPPSPYWSAVSLPAELPDGALFSVAFSGNSSAAVGSGVDNTGLLLENTSQGWVTIDVPELQSGVARDVGIDGSGRRVIVGATPASQEGLIIAERPDWSSVFAGAPPTALFDAIDVDDAGNFVAAGAQTAEVAAWSGTAEGAWSEVPITAPGDPQEKSLVDVAYGAGVWVACGFDDGGEGTPQQPYAILMLDQGSGWESISAICAGCGSHEFKSVAIDDAGLIYLGGAQTDFSNGASDEYIGFLWTYAPDIEEWTTIALPDPGSLDRVNDILLSANGDVYLACGVDIASLVRLPVGGESDAQENIEYVATATVLYGLAQTNGGDVYAVGQSGLTSSSRPLMLLRTEPNP